MTVPAARNDKLTQASQHHNQRAIGSTTRWHAPLALLDAANVHTFPPDHLQLGNCLQRHKPIPFAASPIVAAVDEHAVGFEVILCKKI